MININHITWIILAGGKATRMQGQDKGLLKFNEYPLVEHIIRQIRPVAPRIMINANRNHECYQHYAPVISDAIPDFAGPLAGLHAGLLHADTPWVGILPCDSPFVDSSLLSRFIEQISDEGLAYVADDGHDIQPVFSVLHQSLLSELERYLSSGHRRVRNFFIDHHAIHVDCQDIPSVFININTPEQLIQLSHEHQ